MNSIIQAMKDSATQWDISPKVAWWIAILPVFGAFVVAATLVDRPLYRFVTMEDGPVEWGQFIFYALTCCTAAGVALRRFKTGPRWQGLLYAVFALGMFFVAGEEIAWGQRILGLTTPAELEKINHQGELTVHNIQVVQNVFNLILFVAAAYGSAAYFCNRWLHIEHFFDQGDFLLVPPLFLIPAFLVMFGYKLIRFTVIRRPGFVVTKFSEWPELCIAFAFCVFAWLNYRRLASRQPASVPVNTTAPNA